MTIMPGAKSQNISTRGLLDATPHAFVLLDRDHVIRAKSAAYIKLTGASEADLLGRSIYEAFPDTPDDVSGGADMLRAALDRVAATGETERLELRHPIPT